jgi:hypothetical protein
VPSISALASATRKVRSLAEPGRPLPPSPTINGTEISLDEETWAFDQLDSTTVGTCQYVIS